MAGQTDPIDSGRETLLRALREGNVRFVVIGGAALQSHGQRYETEDIDVMPDRTQQNLERLADVLNRLECSLEVDPVHPEKAVLLPPDYFTASVLAQAIVGNLRTVHGKLDLTLAPSSEHHGARGGAHRSKRPPTAGGAAQDAYIRAFRGGSCVTTVSVAVCRTRKPSSS